MKKKRKRKTIEEKLIEGIRDRDWIVQQLLKLDRESKEKGGVPASTK